MRKPSKNIEGNIVPPAAGVTSELPRAVDLRRTGEVEVLKPLIPAEVRAEPAHATFKAFRHRPQPLWFRRFLAVGSGALVMIALVLVTAILVGINDPAAGPDVAVEVTPNDEPTQPQELYSFDVYSPSTFEPATGVSIFPSNPRRRPIHPRIHLVATKPEHQSRPVPHLERSDFVPTTLVIYAENGVINTRIEPWLQDSN